MTEDYQKYIHTKNIPELRSKKTTLIFMYHMSYAAGKDTEYIKVVIISCKCNYRFI